MDEYQVVDARVVGGTSRTSKPKPFGVAMLSSPLGCPRPTIDQMA